jgi:centriolar protein POC1
VVLKGHTGGVRSVNFSNDGRHLITGSDDKTAKIWSLPGRKFECSLVGHSNWIRGAQFSPDAASAATCSDDRQVRLWDVGTHQCLHTFHDHRDVVNCVNFHPEGRCIASGSVLPGAVKKQKCEAGGIATAGGASLCCWVLFRAKFANHTRVKR